MSSDLPDIDENAGDRVASLAMAAGKAIMSTGVSLYLPLIGPLLAEVIGVIIPQRRFERIADTLKLFNEKIAALDAAVREAKIRDEAFQDILEEGVWQAARASSDERKGYIASLLANSLTRDDLSRLQQKRLLAILGELNDAEIIILGAYGFGYTGSARTSYLQQHQDVISEPRTYRGSPQERVDQAAVHKTYRASLLRFGLIKHEYKNSSKGVSVEFDFDTGMLKAGRTTITRLGQIFLNAINAEANIEKRPS